MKKFLANKAQSMGRLTGVEQTMDISWLLGVECFIGDDCDLKHIILGKV